MSVHRLNKSGAAVMVLVCLATLSACTGPTHKIGSTIKGDRLAVLDDTHALQADNKAQTTKIMLPSVTANADWAQAGYDGAHLNPNAALGEHPKELWRADIGQGSDSEYKLLARPVISGNRIYTMDSRGGVSAFDAETGHRKWFVDTTPEDADTDAIGGGVAVAGDTVYVTTGFGEALALNVKDGAVRWRHALLNPVRAAPTVVDGRVYVVTIDNELQALDSRNGDVLWTHNGIVESATLMGAASPAAQGDSVVVAYSSGEVYDLRAESGRVSWDYSLTTPTQIGSLPAIADIRGLPVIDGPRVYAISHSGRMAAIDHRTGERAWEADIGGINTPLVAGNTVYVLSNDNQLVALAKETGRIIWVKALPSREDPDDKTSDALVWAGPVLAGDRLWLTNSLGQVVAWSPEDGKEMASLDADDSILIPPVVANKTLYVVTDDGELVAFR